MITYRDRQQAYHRLASLERRPGTYQRAVCWIALNDDPTVMDWERVAEQLTVVCVADTFGRSAREVAGDVWAYRVGMAVREGSGV